MKIKLGLLLLAGGGIGFAAWLAHAPAPIHADEVPEKYRDTVAKGLGFLAKHQAKDGHWEGEDGKHPMAMTGLVGLALVMERPPNTGRGLPQGRQGKHSEEIKKAADWLMHQSDAKRDGLLFSGHASETSRYMEGHGLATLFLAGVCRDEFSKVRRQQLTEILTRAVKYIGKSQSSQGGWYHTSRLEGHDFDAILPTVIQIQALQAANNAGIPIPAEGLRNGQEYLRRVVARSQDKKSDERKRLSGTIAALVACHNRLGSDVKKGSEQDKWIQYCLTHCPLTRNTADDLDHYYSAQAIFIGGGSNWKQYRATFDHIQRAQDKDGAWPASVGISEGRVYATALWCTILQLDNEHYPAMVEIPREIS